MTARPASLASMFARYERDRAAFALAVADAARQEGNAAPLAALGAPALLLPLLNDPADTVAHTAAFALGRLAGHSRSAAAVLANAGVVGTLIGNMQREPAAAAHAEQAPHEGGPSSPSAAADRRYAAKRAAVGMLVSLMRHSPQLAGAAADQGGLQAAVACLGEADAETREGAAWALAHAAAHDEQLAARVCAAGALPPLVACLRPSSACGDSTFKRVAASALGDISGHSAALAAQLVAAGAVGACAALLRAPLCNDARLKRQLLCMLMHVAKAGPELAQSVVDAGAVPDVARCLKFNDETVRRHAAACLRELVRHGDALAAAVVEAPGDALNQLAAYAASTSSAQALPALTALGFAAEHSPELAAKVAAAPGALAALSAALHNLQAKCLRAAGSIIGQHADVAQLAALVMQPELAPQLAELLLARCAAVMAKQPATRAAFASSGALAHLEARQAEVPADSAAGQHIAACLRLFPEELLRHYSPAYKSKLLSALSTDPPPADAIAAACPAAEAVQAIAESASAAADDEAPAAADPADSEAGGEQPQDAALAVAEQASDGAESVVPAHEDAPAVEEQDGITAEVAEAAPAPAEEPAAAPTLAAQVEEPASTVQQEAQQAAEHEPAAPADEEIADVEAAGKAATPMIADEGETPAPAQEDKPAATEDGEAPAAGEQAAQPPAEVVACEPAAAEAEVVACEPAAAEQQAVVEDEEPASAQPAPTEEQEATEATTEPMAAEKQAEQEAAADAANEPAIVEADEAPVTVAAAEPQAAAE
ncbi:hypothetical protein ABPG75_003120 [Micractinium tetrahymenae]